MARKVRHDLSNYRLFTGDMGKLYPVGLVEVLPGDHFRHATSLMARLSPMAAPVMHSMRARIHHFFVPHRLSWPEGYATTWENFITGGPDGTESNPLPTITTTGVPHDALDYLGLPQVAGISVSSLPLRAYNLVFNEWYRDQDLVTERNLEQTDIPHIAWGKDYFTTARPWAQRGEEVSLPLGTSAPVRSANWVGESPSSIAVPAGGDAAYTPTGTTGNYEWDNQGGTDTGIWADLQQATAATINSLRRASALQRFAENRARWGARYTEYVQKAFGARPLDSRLQRPEYLGGGTTQVSISEILQTAPDSAGDPRFGVGDMFGHGIAAGRANGYRRKFQEHGYVVSCVSIRPRSIYVNGIDRTFLRKDREDFFQHELAHIGQQQVLEQELFADAGNADNVFGWSDRYAEYRNVNSRATGEFRGILDYWHMGRIFLSAPALNQTFVDCQPSKRIFNEQTAHSLWAVASHQIQALRVVPRNATGRLL